MFIIDTVNPGLQSIFSNLEDENVTMSDENFQSQNCFRFLGETVPMSEQFLSGMCLAFVCFISIRYTARSLTLDFMWLASSVCRAVYIQSNGLTFWSKAKFDIELEQICLPTKLRIFIYKRKRIKLGSARRADRAQFNAPTMRSPANLHIEYEQFCCSNSAAYAYI